MRLLNVHTRQLEEFFADFPPYAILSHTWGKDEVSFQDLPDVYHVRKHGYAKIDGTCRLANAHGFNYAWIDTCCIDKSSSAELSEAINSMFSWYRASTICFAYLSDIDVPLNLDEPNRTFERSRWFTRGWTLQELLAPKQVTFYNSQWQILGHRNDMRELLSAITSIPEDCLGGFHPEADSALEYNTAQRMAWASGRHTTRAEDAAYCLIGVFGVHIPLLYGEGGERAFVRLQREILNFHTDESILAWNLDITLGSESDSTAGFFACILNQLGANPDSQSSQRKPRMAFALSPAEFAPWRLLQRHRFSPYPGQLWRPGTALQQTNRGLRVTLPIVAESNGLVLAVLNCSLDQRVDRMLMIPLIAVGPVDHPNCYLRCTNIPALVGSFSILSLAKMTTIFMQVYVREFEAKRMQLAGKPQLRDGVILADTADEDIALVAVENATWNGGQVIHPSKVCNKMQLKFALTRDDSVAEMFQVIIRPESGSGTPQVTGNKCEFGVQYSSKLSSMENGSETYVNEGILPVDINGTRLTVEKTEQHYLGFDVTLLRVRKSEPEQLEVTSVAE